MSTIGSSLETAPAAGQAPPARAGMPAAAAGGAWDTPPPPRPSFTGTATRPGSQSWANAHSSRSPDRKATATPKYRAV